MIGTLLCISALAGGPAVVGAVVLQPVSGAPVRPVSDDKIERSTVPVGVRVDLANPGHRWTWLLGAQIDLQSVCWRGEPDWNVRGCLGGTWVRGEPMVGGRVRVGDLEQPVVPGLEARLGSVFAGCVRRCGGSRVGAVVHLGAGLDIGAGPRPVRFALEGRLAATEVRRRPEGKPLVRDPGGAGLAATLGWGWR